MTLGLKPDKATMEKMNAPEKFLFCCLQFQHFYYSPTGLFSMFLSWAAEHS